MSSPTLITPNHKPKPLPPPSSTTSTTLTRRHHLITTTKPSTATTFTRRHLIITTTLTTGILAGPSKAASDEEYVKETQDMISKVRTTVNMDKTGPGVAEAVAELRAAANEWVAKYRKEKALLGKPSFRDMYSALNAVAGHYISFGPTTPIPAKRKARILEEMDSAEQALQRGR